MKIAFFLSSRYILPPKKTGGVEQPSFYLIKELIKRGHDVTLFSAPGSKIPGVKKVFTSPFVTTVKLGATNLWERITSYYDLKSLSEFFNSGYAKEFDIIQYNNYIFYEILPFAKYSSTPIIIQINYTHKDIYPYLKDDIKKQKNVYYLPMSNFVKTLMPGLKYTEPVYPVFDYNDFGFSNKKGEYLLFIGRICPEKGVDIAIQVARKAKEKLVIAGKVNEENKMYFNHFVRPYVDNKQIVYVGEVDFKTKNSIYKKALATLFPITWDEPFGIVNLESMICGTPVIAFDRAAVREIIKNNVNGYIVKDGDIDGMVKCVKKIGTFDRNKVRCYVIKNFSLKNEAMKYENICKKILTNK